MPLKDGKLTPREKVFTTVMAATSDQAYAGQKAKFASASGASMAMARPEIQGEIRRLQERRLNDTLLPAAIAVLEDVLTSKAASERGKLMAAKIVLDRTLGAPGSAAEAKEPHEMTGDEIAAAISTLRSQLAARADKAKDITPAPVVDDAPGAAIFD